MLIKNARHAAAVLALVIFAIPAAQAQTGTQNVEYSVASIQKIALSGAPALDITLAVAGSAPTSVTNSATPASYAITTNVASMKITASLDANMPTGLTLSANLTKPAGATSAGTVALTTAAADMVTSIGKLNASGLGITYTLDATSAAGVVTSATAVVTYTVTTGT